MFCLACLVISASRAGVSAEKRSVAAAFLSPSYTSLRFCTVTRAIQRHREGSTTPRCNEVGPVVNAKDAGEAER